MAPGMSPEVYWRGRGGWLILAIWVLIVLGSLYPLSGWRQPVQPWADWLFAEWPRWLRVGEWLVNVLLYAIPAFLLVQWLSLGQRRLGPVVLALSMGILASLALESVQSWLPDRVPSNADLLANGLGACLGAVLAYLVPVPPARLWPLDRLIALVLLLAWPLSQWVSASALSGLTGSLLPSAAGLSEFMIWLRRFGIEGLPVAHPGVQGLTVLTVGGSVLVLARWVFDSRRAALLPAGLLLTGGWVIAHGWVWSDPDASHWIGAGLGFLIFLLTPRRGCAAVLLLLLLTQAILASLLLPGPYGEVSAAPDWLNMDVWLALLNRAWPWLLILLLARRSL